jgi:hypothetical protein
MAAIGGMLQLDDRSLHRCEWQFGQRDEAMRSDIVKFFG